MPCCCVVLARVCWRAIWDAQVKCRGIQKGGFRCFWEVKELTSGIQQDTSYTWLHFSGDCYKKHFLLEFLVLFFAQFKHWHEFYRFTYPLHRVNLSDGLLKQITSLLNSVGYKEVNFFARNINAMQINCPYIIVLYWYILQRSWRGAHTFVCITLYSRKRKGSIKALNLWNQGCLDLVCVFFFFSTPGLSLMLGSKSSLFCSKICGTNKKVKSTRYASHLCLYWSPDNAWLAALILCCYCCLVVQFLEQKGDCFQSTLFSKDKSKFS